MWRLTVLFQLWDVFLEFDALSRLGIPDAVSYIRKRYKTAQLLFLKAACVGQGLVDQVEASVEEAISSGTWVDIAVCFFLLNLSLNQWHWYFTEIWPFKELGYIKILALEPNYDNYYFNKNNPNYFMLKIF